MVGREQKIDFFHRYFAEKSVFGQHGKKICNENLTRGKIAKKSGKSAIFLKKLKIFDFSVEKISRVLHAPMRRVSRGKIGDLSPINSIYRR